MIKQSLLHKKTNLRISKLNTTVVLNFHVEGLHILLLISWCNSTFIIKCAGISCANLFINTPTGTQQEGKKHIMIYSVSQS